MLPTARKIDPHEIVYLLGISPTAPKVIVDGIEAEFPLIETTPMGDMLAWFVRVEREQFEGEQAEDNLADVAWLTPRVVAHQTAVELLTGTIDFFPARFGTLFSSLERVEEMVIWNRDTILQFLLRTSNHQEWGLKCIADWDHAVKQYNLLHGDPLTEDTGKGANYLRQQKMIRDRDQKVRIWIQEEISAIEAHVLSLASDTFLRRPMPTDNPKKSECLLNIALLLESQGRDALLDWVNDWNANQNATQPKDEAGWNASSSLGSGSQPTSCLKLELTGPWPLYSFCPMLDEPHLERAAA